MRMLAYQGISAISKAIRWQTRSKYSHIGIELDDGSVVEAWHKGGVQHSESFRTLHTPGTKVDVYRVTLPVDVDSFEKWLLEQVGKQYDFRSVARFLTRREVPLDDKWFCSELYGYGLWKAGGLKILNGNPSEWSPRDVAMSPFHHFVRTVVC